MIKVLKYGKKKVTCPHCGSVLLYDREDINRRSRPSGNMISIIHYSEIQCPICLESVEVCDD